MSEEEELAQRVAALEAQQVALEAREADARRLASAPFQREVDALVAQTASAESELSRVQAETRRHREETARLVAAPARAMRGAALAGFSWGMLVSSAMIWCAQLKSPLPPVGVAATAAVGLVLRRALRARSQREQERP